MIKTYISSLLVVLIGAQAIRAQESIEDVFAQLDAAQTIEGEQVAPVPAELSAVPVAVAKPVQVVEPVAAEVAGPEVAQQSVAVVESDLLSKGIKAYRAGELAKAEEAFEAVLDNDPYNRRAMNYLKRTAQKIAINEEKKQSGTRAQAFSKVEAAWNSNVNLVNVDLSDAEVASKPANQAAIEKMQARLQSIVIPTLDFQEANIEDVVLFLTESLRRNDPTQKGVNILLMGMEDSIAAGQNNITISIRDMNALEALQYIVEIAALKFEVQAKAVAIMPVNYVAAADFKLVSYDVIPEVGAELEAMGGGNSGGADDLFGDPSEESATGPIDVAGFFSIVEWPEGSSAVYQPKFQKLFVKNTAKNLEGVEAILADLEDNAIARRSQQVEIEAKFVEFSEGAMEELGFDWDVYGRKVNGELYYGARDLSTGNIEADFGVTPRVGQELLSDSIRNSSSAFEALQSGILATMGGNPASMLFGGEDFDLAISALEQEGTADVLSAPRVTTKSGNEAIIKVVEVHRYPQDWDVETGQRTAPVAKPQDWEDYDLGVVLKVTPVVDAESNTIDLELNPEIRKLKGQDSYKVADNAYDTGGTNNSEAGGDGSELYATMPFFEVRSIETQVTIADGATVVMGGLVDEQTETFRDQVPFLGDIPYLGRLFRSEGTRTTKKNLTIFVKATQVDANGMSRAQRELARKAAK
ncbi:MAG TPA: hypothetical protein VIR63_07255 [Pontiella sp.]